MVLCSRTIHRRRIQVSLLAFILSAGITKSLMCAGPGLGAEGPAPPEPTHHSLREQFSLIQPLGEFLLKAGGTAGVVLNAGAVLRALPASRELPHHLR